MEKTGDDCDVGFDLLSLITPSHLRLSLSPSLLLSPTAEQARRDAHNPGL